MKELLQEILPKSLHKQMIWPALVFLGTIALAWIAPLQDAILSHYEPSLLLRTIVALLGLTLCLTAYFSVLIYRLAFSVVNLKKEIQQMKNDESSKAKVKDQTCGTRKPDMRRVFRR